VLAVGLGIGAAMASTGTAAADDIQISIDGIDLFPASLAHATSGLGDMAIAIGAGSDAVAEGGFGDFASADGGATAIAGDEASGAALNDFDFASGTGTGAVAVAGNGAGVGSFTDDSCFDLASANGDGSQAAAGFNGSLDSAIADGTKTGATAGLSINAADPANFDSAISVGTGSVGEGNAVAGGDPTGSATFQGGSFDSAFVYELLGLQSSDATAGLGANFDVAGALGEGLNAVATGSPFVFDILPL
jgi:hypothetical protein